MTQNSYRYYLQVKNARCLCHFEEENYSGCYALQTDAGLVFYYPYTEVSLQKIKSRVREILQAELEILQRYYAMNYMLENYDPVQQLARRVSETRPRNMIDYYQNFDKSWPESERTQIDIKIVLAQTGRRERKLWTFSKDRDLKQLDDVKP